MCMPRTANRTNHAITNVVACDLRHNRVDVDDTDERSFSEQIRPDSNYFDSCTVDVIGCRRRVFVSQMTMDVVFFRTSQQTIWLSADRFYSLASSTFRRAQLCGCLRNQLSSAPCVRGTAARNVTDRLRVANKNITSDTRTVNI